MRAPSWRASATALPTTWIDRSVSSTGTKRWRYMVGPGLRLGLMLGRPRAAHPPRDGGASPRAPVAAARYHRWRSGPGARDDPRARPHQRKESVANDASRNAPGITDALLLRITPPRVPRHQLARPRLQSDDEQLRDHPLILVQAPAGFGKTSLLAQWRREHLAHGSVVAWLSAQPQD